MRLQALTEFDYHHTLARAPGASLVLFSSPDCGSCRKVESLLATALGAAGDAIQACYKVDVQQATALARQYELFHLPALFLYKDGHFHAVLQSEVAPHALRGSIANALSRPAQEEP